MSTSYPYCQARGVLIETKGGTRASLSGLYAAMTPEEWGAWFRRSANDPPIDDYGAAVEPIEAFLSQFPMPAQLQRNLFA